MTHRDLEEQLRAEIAERRRDLEAIQSVGPMEALLRGQLEVRIAEVERELAVAVNPILVLRLKDEENSHAVEAKRLGSILTRLQDSITRAGWAIRTGADDQRDPPASIIQGTTFDVLAFASGSFQITLRHLEHTDLHQLQLETETAVLAEEAVEKLMILFRAAERAELDTEELEDLASQLGKGPSDSVQKLLAQLVEGGLTAEFNMEGMHSTAATLQPPAADRLRGWLRTVQENTERIEITARLTLGDEDDGNFRLVDDAGTPYEGKGDPDILAGRTIGMAYDAVLDRVTSVGEHTGTIRTKYVLRSLRSPGTHGGD